MVYCWSVKSDSATPWTAACQDSLSFTISRGLLKLMSIESMMPSNHLILCRCLLLLTSICPSVRIFSNKLALRIKWPKCWSFNFSSSPCNEYLGMVRPTDQKAAATKKSLLQIPQEGGTPCQVGRGWPHKKAPRGQGTERVGENMRKCLHCGFCGKNSEAGWALGLASLNTSSWLLAWGLVPGSLVPGSGAIRAGG